MSNIVADLHVHTTESDGTTEPSRIPDLARENNLDVIAITDHDMYHDFGQPVVNRGDVNIISGMELRVKAESIGERVDLLGYGVTSSEELDRIVESVRSNRKKRAEEIVSRIEEKTGAELDINPNVSTGRPHIAKAVDRNDEIPYDYQGTFDNLIGKDHYCYVSRDIPSFNEGVEVLKKSSLCVSLAHPYRYKNVEKAVEMTENLDAIECNYLYSDSIESGNLPREKASQFEIGVTGGSDAHEPTSIGSCGLNREEIDNFFSRFGFQEHL